LPGYPEFCLFVGVEGCVVVLASMTVINPALWVASWVTVTP
jgi:hypothetical protein